MTKLSVDGGMQFKVDLRSVNKHKEDEGEREEQAQHAVVALMTSNCPCKCGHLLQFQRN